MKNIFIIIFFFFISFSNAQTAKELINKVLKVYRTSNYKVDVTYALYKGFDKEVIEQYKGKYIVTHDSVYNKINHTEIVITPNFFVKINHDEKAVIYNKIENKSKKESYLNLDKLLKNFEKPEVINKGNQWQIKMTTKEFSQLKLSRLTLLINKKSYRVEKQILILSVLTNFSKNIYDKDDFSLPRLEISFGEYQKLNKLDLEIFNEKNYIINNKNISLSNKLKNYKIIN